MIQPHITHYFHVKPGIFFSRRQSHVCLYLSWQLSPAQVDDCRQQPPTIVFKVQPCWTFNAVVSSRWHFSPNQWAATAFIRLRPMQTRGPLVIKHQILQTCICHQPLWLQKPQKEGEFMESIGKQIERDGKHKPTSILYQDIIGKQITHWKCVCVPFKKRIQYYFLIYLPVN